MRAKKAQDDYGGTCNSDPSGWSKMQNTSGREAAKQESTCWMEVTFPIPAGRPGCQNFHTASISHAAHAKEGSSLRPMVPACVHVTICATSLS